MQILKALTMSAGLLAATSAAAIPAASIKREVPLNVLSYGAKNTPLAIPTDNPCGMAFDGLQVWVGDRANNKLYRFDIGSNVLKGTYTFPANTSPTAVVFDGTSIWVPTMSGMLYKFTTAGVVASGFPKALNAGAAWGAIFDGDNVWVSTEQGVVKVSVSNGTPARPVASPISGAGPIVFDGKDLWVGSNGLSRHDGATGAATFFTTDSAGPSSVLGMAFDGRFVWVNSQSQGFIEKWDPATNTRVASFTTHPDPRGMAFDGTYLWVVCCDGRTVIKIDVAANRVVDSIPMPVTFSGYSAVFDGTHVWVAGWDSNSPGTGRIYKLFAKFN